MGYEASMIFIIGGYEHECGENMFFHSTGRRN
jgi:hypothetical protein